MLIKTGVPTAKANIMGSAVYLNAGWALKKARQMPAIDDIFKEILIT